jgi:hypothetical protein
MPRPKNSKYNEVQNIISFTQNFKKPTRDFYEAARFINPKASEKGIDSVLKTVSKGNIGKGPLCVIMGPTNDSNGVYAEVMKDKFCEEIPQIDMFEDSRSIVLLEDTITVPKTLEAMEDKLQEVLHTTPVDDIVAMAEKVMAKPIKKKAKVVVTTNSKDDTTVELVQEGKKAQIISDEKEDASSSVGAPAEVIRLVQSLKNWGINVKLPKMCKARKVKEKDATLYLDKTQIPSHLRSKTCMVDSGSVQFYGVPRPDIQVCNVKQLVTTNGAKKLAKKLAAEVAMDIKISKEIPAMIPSLACNSWSYESIVKVIKRSIDLTIRDQRKVVSMEIFNEALEAYDEVRKRDMQISSLEHQKDQMKDHYENMIKDLQTQIAMLTMKMRG